MGQASSQPERRTPDTPRRSPSVLRRALQPRSLGRSQDGLQDGLLNDDHARASPSANTNGAGGSSNNNGNSGSGLSLSRRRLCELFRSSHNRNSVNTSSQLDPEPDMDSLGPALLHRTRSRFHEMLRRDSLSAPRPSFSRHRSSYVRSAPNSGSNNNNITHEDDENDGDDDFFAPPRLDSIDMSPFDHDPLSHRSESEPAPRTGSSSRRSLSMMLNPLRPDRSPRRLASTLRRRRSPHPSLSSVGSRGIEDQATILSRLLSVAAAATAATLMGLDPDEINEARSLAGAGLGDWAGGGEDGSFDGFLRALENGRIASALRESGTSTEGTEPGQAAPLNIFRMFRFGATNAAGAVAESGTHIVPRHADTESGNEGRMVPIIIVGIRSISPGSGAGSSADELPPFIDALGHFPPPVPPHALGTHAHDTIDSILRPPQNGTSFRHRRRASMGAFGMGRNRLNDRMDDQRDHRSPERRRERPWSVASSSSTFDPRSPPTTTASPSPELSRMPSRNSTPDTSRPSSRPTSMLENTLRDLAAEPRRNRGLHRSATNPSALSAHTEETTSLHSTHSATNLLGDSDQFRLRRNDTTPHVHYPRFSSGHPRRNGVVEPDHLPSLSRSSTGNASDSSNNNEGRGSGSDSRSWIIYVLGGSYPENHPILTTPSLFTENPTYEDMMLLSALLGPAKAPVATEEDVESAGGVYEIRADPTLSSDANKTAQLVAAAVDGEDRVALEPGQRCLVCLCDFEPKEVARKLAKCKHLFHKECIDQWLTTGRNSCPLCREQGVDEKEQESTAVPAPSSADAANVPAAAVGA